MAIVVLPLGAFDQVYLLHLKNGNVCDKNNHICQAPSTTPGAWMVLVYPPGRLTRSWWAQLGWSLLEEEAETCVWNAPVLLWFLLIPGTVWVQCKRTSEQAGRWWEAAGLTWPQKSVCVALRSPHVSSCPTPLTLPSFKRTRKKPGLH